MAISYELAFQLVQESLDSMHRTGLISQAVAAQEDTVLLGPGSPLDSIGFVTFITELEDRVSRESGRELYLVLKDLHEGNAKNKDLSVGIMARYLVKLTGEG
jgi:hypothetical protein